MTINKCRVCKQTFYEAPLIEYKNMPATAQNLPNKESLKSEKGIDIKVCQCSGCGLVQLSNDPVFYYREVIRAAAFSEEMKAFRVKQFSEFVQNYSLTEKKIIEIGCGRGEYLNLMKETGADVYGLEFSEDSAKQCIENGLNVSAGFIENPDSILSDAPYNAFFILNFLEHLPDPNSLLRGMYNNLKKDGIGLVEVPNFDMILRNNLFSEFTSDHLLYFTKETLSFALILNGFEIVECNEIWHNYIISAVVRKSEKLDILHFNQYQTNLKNELQEFINCFENQKVAIWGAGHQALAVIAMANLSGKIKYILDSATFKQGKYSPATHIPIVAPQTLESAPVDAVIVMAASYSDEVAKIIKEKFDRNIKIAILRDFGLEII